MTSPNWRKRGYQQLLDLGLSATKIAKATGTTRTRVRDALAVTKSDTALCTASAHGLTLDQALVLTEFAGDDEALDTLTDAAVEDPDRLLHVASRIRQDRERQADTSGSWPSTRPPASRSWSRRPSATAPRPSAHPGPRRTHRRRRPGPRPRPAHQPPRPCRVDREGIELLQPQARLCVR